jgi:hypothetical protein
MIRRLRFNSQTGARLAGYTELLHSAAEGIGVETQHLRGTAGPVNNPVRFLKRCQDVIARIAC